MELKLALEIGKDCGLETAGEAMHNIVTHALSIFGYDEIHDELKGLEREFESSGFSKNDSIDYCLNKLSEVI